MRFRPRSRRAHGDAEKGVVLVEFAFVFIFIFSLAMGMVEYGLAYRAQQNALAGSRTGSRTAASLGKDWEADYQALSSLRADLSSSGLLNQIELVVIYRSDTPDGRPPASCIAGTGTTASCNVFNRAQIVSLAKPTFSSTTGCSSNSVSNGWCPVTRQNDQNTADYLGVYVRIRHPFITGVYGSGLTITQRSIMRIEPTGE